MLKFIIHIIKIEQKNVLIKMLKFCVLKKQIEWRYYSKKKKKTYYINKK